MNLCEMTIQQKLHMLIELIKSDGGTVIDMTKEEDNSYLEGGKLVDYSDDEEEEEPIICEDCDRDFTDECDGRSSFEEVEKVQCMDCFDHPECDDCGEKMMLDSSEPYCDAGCEREKVLKEVKSVMEKEINLRGLYGDVKVNINL